MPNCLTSLWVISAAMLGETEDDRLVKLIRNNSNKLIQIQELFSVIF